MPKTVIVSNRLPVKIQQAKSSIEFTPSEGGLATGLGSIYKTGDNIWLGWPGLAIAKSEDRKSIKTRLNEQNMHPVFLSNTEIEEFYEGFSNETLWPNFHYFNQYSVFDESNWKAYKRVNKKFGDEVEKVLGPDDTVWIHDYQLLLLPEILRKNNPNISIGFFLHIPFPSYESFRILPWRRELLLGMLGADFVGFHTYDDMRHFLSSVNRLAGFGSTNGQIKVGNRLVVSDALPMGIDYDKYARTASEPETLDREVRYRTSLGDVQVVLSIDRLDYSKGIPQRLKAFEKFLESNTEFKEKVSLVMVVVPSRDNVEKYARLKEEIDLLVGRINGRFARLNWTPIHYFYRSFPINALSAFYRIAHVALVTPMRDGMNLVCKEYIASKLDKRGVLILSEMAGSAKELSDAILINPNDIDQLVAALKEALTMPKKEQERRMDIMQRSLKRYNIHSWVSLFMERLNYVKQEQANLLTKPLSESIQKELDSAYRNSKKRIMFLDYDGTLVGFNTNPYDSKPDDELKKLLKQLSKDDRNEIVIISGRGRDTLEKWLEPFKVNLIGEHGVWHKKFGGQWKKWVNLDNSWKSEFTNVLEMYVDRTPGSFIEDKDFSLVWHYRKVETGLGELRSGELKSHLKYIASEQDIQIQEGDKVIEIKSSVVNKGTAAKRWLKNNKFEFAMACGDDWTDEDTFKAMPSNAYTVKVGSSSSVAKYQVENYKDIRGMLKAMIS